LTAGDLLTARNARILLGLAMAASGALLLAWHAHLTFQIDDWDVLLARRGFNAHVLFDSHGRHLILSLVLVYKAIQATLGMDSILPYAAAAIISFLASVLLLFVYLSRRVGEWAALAAVLPVLVMGTAYQDLLTTFQICYFGSMALGLGALLAIESADRRGDLIACALLVASLAFSEIALAFAAGVLVAIVLQHGPLRRAWTVAVPFVVYAVWYLSFGSPSSDVPSTFSAHNVATSPVYVLDGFASGIAALLGLGTPMELAGSGGLDWGRPLLVALVGVATAWALRTRTRLRGWILVPVTVGVSFWLMTAANFGLGRPPDASRYKYMGAVFVLMIAAELAAGWRPGWKTIVGVVAVGLVAALGNLAILHDGYRNLRGTSATVRGGLGGLEIAADHVNPNLVLTSQNSNFNYFTFVSAGPYLSAAEKFGSPAYSESELGGAPEQARTAGDKVLAAALPVSIRQGEAQPESGAAPPSLLGPPDALVSARGSCVTTRSVAGVAPILALPPGGAILIARGDAPHQLSLRRFATESFPVSAGILRGTGSLVIPTDRSSRPWQLQIGGDGPLTACRERSP
jgi:hypothetical protein